MSEDRHYVRVFEWYHDLGQWHEMADEAEHKALCGTKPDYQFVPSEDVQELEIQHQRGTDFPRGERCFDCNREREWLDRDQYGPITNSVEKPAGW